jgi:putative oxidoreductase
MTDTFTTNRRPNPSGEEAMSRLADRLAALAPPPLELQTNSIMQPSPAVMAAMATAAALSKRAHERARRSRSVVGLTVDGFIGFCSSFFHYAVVGLALRLVMARIFFLDGQTRIEGMRFPLTVQDFMFTVIVPMQVKAETFSTFMTKYAAVPIPPMIGAYLLSYGEFILPILLVLGFGTRFAALGLLIITALIQLYVMPGALWTTHIYWAAILLVLVSRGAGQISLDHVIRFIARR